MKHGPAKQVFRALVSHRILTLDSKRPEIVKFQNINASGLKYIFKMKPFILFSSVLLFLISSWNIGFSQSRHASSSIVLRGQSSGGVLTLMKAPGGNYPFIIVTNRLNESAASVVDNLLFQLTNCSTCATWYGGKYVFKQSSNSLVLLGGTLALKECSSWILGGTDTGFDIPPPPVSVSASHQAGQVTLQWSNPPSKYDSIIVICNGAPIPFPLSGNSTSWTNRKDAVIPLINPDSDDQIYMILGYKNGTPSNGSGIRVAKLNKIESLMNIPFTCGIAPSFEKWSYDTTSENLKCKQGNLAGMAPNTDVAQFDGKGFYQIVSGNNTYHGGVFRRFLGLAPGHTYRVMARVNTLEMAQGTWDFTLHAAYNPADGNCLSDAQMAGIDELPDKSKGAGAGLIAKFDAGSATKGNWVAVPSKSSGAEAATTIKLPNDINSLTVWCRFNGAGITNGAIGMDSISIEELGKQ